MWGGTDCGCVWAKLRAEWHSTEGADSEPGNGSWRPLAGSQAGRPLPPGPQFQPGREAAPGGGPAHGYWPLGARAGRGSGPRRRVTRVETLRPWGRGGHAAAGPGRGGGEEDPPSPPLTAPFLALKRNHYRLCIQLNQPTEEAPLTCQVLCGT